MGYWYVEVESEHDTDYFVCRAAAHMEASDVVDHVSDKWCADQLLTNPNTDLEELNPQLTIDEIGDTEFFQLRNVGFAEIVLDK